MVDGPRSRLALQVASWGMDQDADCVLSPEELRRAKDLVAKERPGDKAMLEAVDNLIAQAEQQGGIRYTSERFRKLADALRLAPLEVVVATLADFVAGDADGDPKKEELAALVQKDPEWRTLTPSWRQAAQEAAIMLGKALPSTGLEPKDPAKAGWALRPIAGPTPEKVPGPTSEKVPGPTSGTAAVPPWLKSATIPSSTKPTKQNPNDGDPVHHMKQLLKIGDRPSPSPNLDRAAQHIAGVAKSYGLIGPMPGDQPHFQPFKLFTYSTTYTTHDGKPVTYERYLSELDHDWLQKSTDLSFSPKGRAQNVMGFLPGTGPNKHEVVVLMAHYDTHDRTGGADDNTSGTAVVLGAIPALVEAQRQGKLDRSVLFLWTAAEERGKIGAKEFIHRQIPGLGLDAIEAVVNVDMVARHGSSHISIVDEGNDFADILQDANKSMGKRAFASIDRNIEFLKHCQDGHRFAKEKEKTLFIFEGLDAKGELHQDYHKPSDTLAKIIADNGGEKVKRVGELVTGVVMRAANPGPKPNS